MKRDFRNEEERTHPAVQLFGLHLLAIDRMADHRETDCVGIFMKTADEFLTAAAETFKEKNRTYGDNYKNVGVAMTGFFPAGVKVTTADDWNRMHIFLLAVVKLSRYANNWEGGGHADSVHDMTVYSAMLESIDSEIAGRVQVTAHGKGAGYSPVQGEVFKSVSTFALCNRCVHTDLCTSEEHCNREYNGLR